MPIKVMLLRYQYPDGRSKDWAYPTPVLADAPNFTVYFGRTGATLRQRDTPAAACEQRNPVAEATQRRREKQANGYQVLGDYWLADNRQDLRPVLSTPTPSEPEINAASNQNLSVTGPSLYWWLLKIQDQDAEAALENVGQAVAGQLEQVGWPLTPPRSGANVLTGFWTATVSGATHGRVELLPGHEPVVAFLLLMARRCTWMRVANEDQQVVTDWPRELPVSEHRLETLGLAPVSTERLLASMAGEAWFY